MQLEGISVVIPLSKIYAVYEGGKEAFWRDHHPSEGECDGEILRMSFSNSTDVECMIEDWKRRGLKPTRKQKGQICWQDLCVVDLFSGPTLPCDWLEYDPENFSARLKHSQHRAKTEQNFNISQRVGELNMKSINLEFKGPFPGKLFVKKELYLNDKPKFRISEIVPTDSERPGVYVWGFMINDKFIPYYVGKHQISIANRIQSHLSDILKPGSTYVRLSKDYMEGPNPFYNDECFPFETFSKGRNKLPGWVKKHSPEYFEKRIDYMNNKAFLEKKYKDISFIDNQRDYPIHLIGDDKYDYLIDNIDKLYVGYVSYDSKDYLNVGEKVFFEFLETFIKYSLKGKTGSKSWTFDTMKKKEETFAFEFKIENLDSCKAIFKPKPSKEFLGY